MLKVSVQLNLSDLTEELYHQIDRAVRDTANTGYDLWQDAINRASLGETTTQTYINSLKTESTGLCKAAIWTDYDKAAEIENGRPEKDLKKYLQTSQKTRLSKQGNRYLIIPFRHNTTGNTAHAQAMPNDIYKQAKKLSTSRVLSLGRDYQWGGRLQSGLAPKAKDHHKTDLYAGMVRMETSAGKSNTSSYLTFRVMSEKSTGWIVPAKAGLKIAEGVQQQLQGILEAKLKDVTS